MPEKKAKLIYIVSQGHSGSTLLDLICGSIPGVFSMGEMHFFSWQLYQGNIPQDPQTKCSCGNYFDNCDFWSHIIEDINKENSIDIFAKPSSFNISINRPIQRYKKSIRHKILNKIFKSAISKKNFFLLDSLFIVFIGTP